MSHVHLEGSRNKNKETYESLCTGFGCRVTMMAFMAWLTVTIFITFFAPSLSVLAFGQAMCGIPWGVFQVRIYE